MLLARATGWKLLVQMPVVVAVGVLLFDHAGLLIVASFAGVTVVSALFDAALIGLTVTQRTAAGARIAMVATTVSQLAGVAVVLVAPTASGVWVARYAAGVIGPLAAVLVLDPALRRAVFRPRLPRGMPPGFWRFALQFVGSGLLGLLVFNRSEVLVLELFGDHRGLGLYALSYGLAVHLAAPVDAATTPLVAGLGGLLASSPALVGRGLLRAQRLVALVSGALVAMVVPALVLVVPVLYGSGYHGAGMLLAVLAVVSTLRVLKHPVDALLNARRRAGVLLKANVTSFIVDAAVAFGAIAVVGVWGVGCGCGHGRRPSSLYRSPGPWRGPARSGVVARDAVELPSLGGRDRLRRRISARRVGLGGTMHPPWRRRHLGRDIGGSARRGSHRARSEFAGR